MSRPRPVDLAIALSLLSRVPVRLDHTAAGARTAQTAWAYPLVGAGLAALAGGIGWGLSALGLPPGPVAALVIAAQILLTGALHEDGLADSADGLWGGWDKARRLEIMRDSRIGAYGVLALGLGVLLRWSCLAALLTLAGPGAMLAALVATGAVSRAAMVAVMASLPFAREDGLSHSVGRVPRWAAIGAGLSMVVIAGIALGLAALFAVIAGLVSAEAARRLAFQRIGGQTGDILGATQQLAEIACLLVLALLAGQAT